MRVNALCPASNDASYVNGQAIAVDGGLSSSHPVTRQLPGQTAVRNCKKHFYAKMLSCVQLWTSLIR